MSNSVDLCQKILIGSFVEGYFHNLRGLLQNLSLHLQKILLQQTEKCPPGILEEVKKAFETLEKLGLHIHLLFEELEEESPGPWELKKIVEEQLLLWNCCLKFKHSIKKEIDIPDNIKVNLPLKLLKGCLCFLFLEVFSKIEKGGQLRISAQRGDYPCLKAEWTPPFTEKVTNKISSQIQAICPQMEISISCKELIWKIKPFS